MPERRTRKTEEWGGQLRVPSCVSASAGVVCTMEGRLDEELTLRWYGRRYGEGGERRRQSACPGGRLVRVVRVLRRVYQSHASPLARRGKSVSEMFEEDLQ